MGKSMWHTAVTALAWLTDVQVLGQVQVGLANKLCRQGLFPALKNMQILNFFSSSACSMELDALSAQHCPPELFLVRENCKPSLAFALGQVFGLLDTSALLTFSPPGSCPQSASAPQHLTAYLCRVQPAGFPLKLSFFPTSVFFDARQPRPSC